MKEISTEFWLKFWNCNWLVSKFSNFMHFFSERSILTFDDELKNHLGIKTFIIHPWWGGLLKGGRWGRDEEDLRKKWGRNEEQMRNRWGRNEEEMRMKRSRENYWFLGHYYLLINYLNMYNSRF